MRLTNIERNALINATQGINGEVFLFGSRVDDTKKGGDIDILVINKSKESNLTLSLRIEREFFKYVEEKLDVIVFNQNMSETDKIFFNNIKKIPLGKIIF